MKCYSDEGFIKKVEVIEADSKKNIEVTLKYFEDKPVIKEFKEKANQDSEDILEVKKYLRLREVWE